MASSSLCYHIKVEEKLSYLIHAIIGFFFLAMILPASTTSLNNNASDHLALLSFKSQVYDPLGVLSSWNTSLHFCQWRGVSCGGRKSLQNIIALELASFNLTGIISPYIANLTILERLDLSSNKFHGYIPNELGRLRSLRSLNLSFNSFDGEIPNNLTQCANLSMVNLRDNMLVGKIPNNLDYLPMLKVLNLGDNSLTGGIPPSMGNISTLNSFFLDGNNLRGSIPDSIGKLQNLQILQLWKCLLSGNISPSLFNISSLKYFTAGENNLSGSLPSHMFQTLPNLKMIILDRNQLYGQIPSSLPNASKLVEIDLQINNFNGAVPSNLGKLQNLYWMNLNSNWLESNGANGWDFLYHLTNCSNLGTLGLSNNRLHGILPSSIANLSRSLALLAIGENYISGRIPDGIGNLVNLTVLILNKNRLTGPIPSSLGRIRKLYILALSDNRFDGQLPSSIGNLTQLAQVDLRASGLSGNIPSSIGKCESIQVLDLSHNYLTGIVPRELGSLVSLSISLDLSDNFLSGELPTQLGELHNLAELDVSVNNLSGMIPTTLGDCQSLERLYMQQNMFDGSIPETLSNLKGIQVLDLSRNNLTGHIPDFMIRMGSLQILNLSFNNIEGQVPKDGVFRNATAVSLEGNKLCGGIKELHLPLCSIPSSSKRHLSLALKIIIPLLAIALCFIMLVAFFVIRKTKRSSEKHTSGSSFEDQFMMLTYNELLRATNCFSISNKIGEGQFSSVYKGMIDDKFVAVKVVNLHQQGASKSFVAECEALRFLRHKNLVKIITVCSSVDSSGNDFKALVLDYMPNGSLESWLHPVVNSDSAMRCLTFDERLRIAIEVASALDYLHHHGVTPVVHCDLKPSNVLLDENMCAYVSDFGLAKLLFDEISGSDEQLSKSLAIRGTIGYVAPEYGMGGKITTSGDVYSYGIILLELFSGKRPTDDTFINGLSLRMYVESAFPMNVMGIVDHRLLLQEDDKPRMLGTKNKVEATSLEHSCLLSIMRIGLLCSVEDPTERMNMAEVIKELLATRHTLWET